MSDDVVRDFIAAELATFTKIASTPTTTNYGIDLVCVSDLDPKLAETRDDTIESLAQDLFHRVTTERGTIIDDPDFGEDVLSYASRAIEPKDYASIAGRLASECRKDDRVSRVVVEVTQPNGPGSLYVLIDVTPADPRLVTFRLIIPVTDGEALLEAILKAS